MSFLYRSFKPRTKRLRNSRANASFSMPGASGGIGIHVMGDGSSGVPSAVSCGLAGIDMPPAVMMTGMWMCVSIRQGILTIYSREMVNIPRDKLGGIIMPSAFKPWPLTICSRINGKHPDLNPS